MDISTALATLTAVGELTKLVVSSKVDAEVKAKATELNNSILSLQGTLFSLQSNNQELLQAKHDLEIKLVKIADWENEASKYKLHQLCPNVFVYALKENKFSTLPHHYICPNCYQESRKSIIQKKIHSNSGIVYLCHNCGFEVTDFNTPRDISF